MKIKIIALSFCSIAFFSCKTVKSGTAKSINISGIGVIHKPVVADLEVSQQKATKTIILKNMETLENGKQQIIREILSENKADLLVEPKYDSVTKNGKTELTVTGWLAYYKNFRMMEEKDIKLFEVRPAIISTVETSQPMIFKK
jgi:hypothetical protein